jgi:hypothetical protein
MTCQETGSTPQVGLSCSRAEVGVAGLVRCQLRHAQAVNCELWRGRGDCPDALEIMDFCVAQFVSELVIEQVLMCSLWVSQTRSFDLRQ